MASSGQRRRAVFGLRPCVAANSDSEERPDLAEPFAAQAVVRRRSCDNRPVLGRVTAYAQVSEFVGDKVVEPQLPRRPTRAKSGQDCGRGHHRAPVEAQGAVRCATRPAAALVPDEDHLRSDTEEACDPLDARRQLQCGALAIPRLEGSAMCSLQSLVSCRISSDSETERKDASTRKRSGPRMAGSWPGPWSGLRCSSELTLEGPASTAPHLLSEAP